MRSRNVKKIHTAGDFKIKGTTLIRYVGKASHVVVPSYIKRLASHAFYENNNIKSVVLPRHIRTIPNECFAWCKNLSSIIMPEVRRLKDGAFAWCTNLSEIDLSDIEYMEAAALYATGLESATLSPRLKEIPPYCFCKCGLLKEVKIPEYSIIKRIGKNAFDDVDSLKSLYIPKTVARIGENFGYAPDLEKITVDRDNPMFFDADGVLCRRNPGGSVTLVHYPAARKTNGILTIGGEALPVNRIGEGAFRYPKFADCVIFEETVERVNFFALAFCDVKEIIIKGADTRIHSTAFCNLPVSNCIVYIPRGFRDEDILRNQRFENINVKYLDEIPYKG